MTTTTIKYSAALDLANDLHRAGAEAAEVHSDYRRANEISQAEDELDVMITVACGGDVEIPEDSDLEHYAREMGAI